MARRTRMPGGSGQQLRSAPLNRDVPMPPAMTLH
jgi:hypothetical protein